MNILYINHYAGSIYHGMEYRPYYLAREWIRLGHKVTIVAGNISHIRTTNVTIPAGQHYLEQKLDGIDYIWCKTSPYLRNGVKRIINIFTFLHTVKKIMPTLLKKFPPDMVIASSTYPFDTKIAAKIAIQSGAKFIYEVHDLWPLTPMELNGMSKFHPFIYLMQLAENFAYRRADKVISLLPKASNYMQEHGMCANKFVYIPNGVSISDWQNEKETIPDTHLQQIKKIKKQYTFLVGYAGGMGKSNALGFLISAASLINTGKIAFVLVGDGSYKQELIHRLKKDKITNVFFLPSIKKSAIPDYLNHMDVLYIGWNLLSIYRFGICPNKLFDYMLSGKPIIHSVSAGNDLVKDANCGISVAAQDVNGIVKAVTDLSQMSTQDLRQIGQNGYNYVRKYHDYPILAKLFLNNCS